MTFRQINSKKDYLYFLECDKKALNRDGKIKIYDNVLRFQILLRKLEYYTNCKKNFFSKIYKNYIKYRYHKESLKIGVEIPINTFGPGLSIAHRGNIIVNSTAKIGANCRIHVGVVIGTEAGYSNNCPTIGDNCHIGPGAKIFGKIKIGDNVVIGANSVVNKSFDSNISIGGVPAKVISLKNSKGYLIEATKLILNKV